MKFKIKAFDDAINESGQIVNKVSSWLRKLSREIDNLLEPINVKLPEYDVDLSDNSPYQQLSEEQLFNLELVNEIKNNIPIYMYLPDELKIFEKEYNNLIQTIDIFKKEFIKNLEKLIAELNLKVPAVNETEVAEITTLKNKLVISIKNIFKTLGIKNNDQTPLLELFKGNKQIPELVEAIKKVILFLKQ
jgi:hypothetical protein